MNSSRKVDVGSVSQTVAARVLGVTTKTVRDWDCPRNGDDTYDLAAVVQWRIEQLSQDRTPSDKAAVELELKRADLELRKLALAEKNGELWQSEWVRSVAHRQTVALREFWSHSWRRRAPELMASLGVPIDRMGAFVDQMHGLICEMMQEWIDLGRDIQPPGKEQTDK